MDAENSAQNDGRPRLVPPLPAFAELGTVLDGRYRLDELIGRGGTAEVYRATDELLGRTVAVKLFDVRLTDLNSVDRQRSEMRALGALDDPHLVAVYDARLVEAPAGPPGRFAPDHSYLVMELVSGGTLAERLHQGPLTPVEAAGIGAAIAGGLVAVHGQGLVHRDVKPANVLLATSGAVKLGDFGLARMLSSETRFTSGASLIGTAAYFSPEQARGDQAGASSDVYALGLVLLECLTARREFPGPAVSSAVARLLRDPMIPDGLSAPWPTLLARMTDQDPDARPTAEQVVRILSDVDDRPAVEDADQPRKPIPILVPVPATSEPPVASNASNASDASDAEPETAAWSSPLSPFLHPGAPGGGQRRRRRSLLVGAAALVTAVGVTLAIGSSGGSPPPAQAAAGSGAVSSGVAAPSTSDSSVSRNAPRSAATSAVPRSTASAPRSTSAERSTSASPSSVLRATTPATVATQEAAERQQASTSVLSTAPPPSAAADPASDARVERARAAASEAAEQQQAAAKQVAERKAAQQRAAEQAAERKAAAKQAAEQKAAEQKAAEQKAAEQRAAEQRAAEQKAEDKKAEDKKAADTKAADTKAAEKEDNKKKDRQKDGAPGPGGPGKKP